MLYNFSTLKIAFARCAISPLTWNRYFAFWSTQFGPALWLRLCCMQRWKWSKRFGQLFSTSRGSFCLGETSLLLKMAETNRPQIIPVRFAWIRSSPFKIIFYFENNPINSFTKSSWESRYLCLFTRGVQFVDLCFSSVKSLFSLYELSRRRRRRRGKGGRFPWHCTFIPKEDGILVPTALEFPV